MAPPLTDTALANAAATTVRRSVARLARRLRAQRPEHGLSLAKLSALGCLHRLGPMTPTELAAHERIRPQSQTRMLGELRGAGLIAQQSDPDDGRARLLLLTTKGREALVGDMRGRDTWLAGALKNALLASELQTLLNACRLMDRLAGQAQNEAEQPAATKSNAAKPRRK